MNKWWRQYCKDVASGARKPENLNFMLGNPCDKFEHEFEMEAEMEAEMKAQEAEREAEFEAEMKAKLEAEIMAEFEAEIKTDLKEWNPDLVVISEADLTAAEKQKMIVLEVKAEMKAELEAEMKAELEAKRMAEFEAEIKADLKEWNPDLVVISEADLTAVEKQKMIGDVFAEIEPECESQLTPSKKKQIQIALSEEVGYSGPIDGNLDGSREAIKAWQKKTNTVETGYVGCEQDKKLIFDNMDAIMAYADKQIEVSKKAAEELAAAQQCELELNEGKKKQLQVALTSENYDPATIDGNLDESREAIIAWQRFNGHTETGYLKCEHIKSVIAQNIDKVMEYATGKTDAIEACAEKNLSDARKRWESMSEAEQAKIYQEDMNTGLPWGLDLSGVWVFNREKVMEAHREICRSLANAGTGEIKVAQKNGRGSWQSRKRKSRTNSRRK